MYNKSLKTLLCFCFKFNAKDFSQTESSRILCTGQQYSGKATKLTKGNNGYYTEAHHWPNRGGR